MLLLLLLRFLFLLQAISAMMQRSRAASIES